MATIWTDEFSVSGDVGTIGFLILTSPQNSADSYSLCDRPAYTNQSHEPRLHGWCGAWNNTSTYAHGLAKVVRITANGRARLTTITDPTEIATALEMLGYPALK